MRRVSLWVFMLALAMPIAAWAQGKPDFSGTWTLDAEKSDPAPQRGGGGGGGGGGRGGGPITIKQTANELVIQSEGRQGPQTLTYKLDGTESSNEMMGRGGTVAVKARAKWDGAKLVIESTRDMGGTTVTVTETRRLDGKDMVVETSTSGGPNGPMTRKTVYTKGM
jgi:hypothetical protein